MQEALLPTAKVSTPYAGVYYRHNGNYWHRYQFDGTPQEIAMENN